MVFARASRRRGRRRRGGPGLEPLATLLDRSPHVHAAVRHASGIDPKVWEIAVGSRIAARARPIELRRGVLWVRVATSVWGQELVLLSEPLLAKLAKHGVQALELRTRVGPVEPFERARSRAEPKRVLAPVPLPAELDLVVRRVADEGLRAAIATAIGRHLAVEHARGEQPARPPRSRAR